MASATPPVPFHRHSLTPEDAAPIAQVLATPFLTSGEVGRGVEAQLRERFEVPVAALTNSWTNGALATLLAWDVQSGDEVVVPAMTFVACANVAALVGARPVLCDVDRDTLLMTPQTLAPALSPRTRVVMPVHLYGQMADVAALRAFLEAQGRSDVKILEDAAHCFEGRRGGARPGAHGDCAIFSFYATKTITCGEGGAVISRDDALGETLLRTRLHGMSAAAIDRFKTGGYRHWDVERLGVKANLPDVSAALLPGQIERAEDARARRAVVDDRYRAAFADADVRVPTIAPDAVHAHHLCPVFVGADRRDALLAGLARAGIGATVNYRALTRLRLYRDAAAATPGGAPVSEAWGDGVVSLPLYPSLTDAEQDHVIATMRALLAAHPTTDPAQKAERAA